MFKLEISLKRVQTFIFDVPRLKAMLGANALIGETLRHALTRRLQGQGQPLAWPSTPDVHVPDDPLNGTVDPDDPAALYAQGLLARDGGHFIAVFETASRAQAFLHDAEALLAERLPGVLYDARISPFDAPSDVDTGRVEARETQILDLPVLQVCQETGQGPASDQVVWDGVDRWQARSVTTRQEWGARFGRGETKDIIGLLRPALYPDQQQEWSEPEDLAELAAGGYLALIHADGNGIGLRYKDWKERLTDSADPVAREARGEAFFHSMRVVVRRALVDALAQTFTARGGPRPYAVLMLGGDDLLMVCQAHRALEFAHHYASALQAHTLADGHPLHVAIGVAIAKDRYPLHRLNALAESLADSAKRLYRALPDPAKTSVIDWQVVTQSWFEGVAEARRRSERVVYQVDGRTETLLLTARPYRVNALDGLQGLLKAARGLDDADQDQAARSPLRGLRAACEQGRQMAEWAFARFPPRVRDALAWDDGALWKTLGHDSQPIHVARALDIIGIREIARLGRLNA